MIRAWKRAAANAWPIYLLELRVRRRRHLLAILWVLWPFALALLLGLGFDPHHLATTPQASGLSYGAFVIVGLMVWQCFADGLLMPLRQLATYRAELLQARMTPELAIGIGLIDLSFALIARFVLLSIVLLALGVAPGAHLTLLPVPLLAMTIGGLAIGMIVALPGLLIDDVPRALNLLLAVGLLGSPVFYDGAVVGWTRFNPLSQWLTLARRLAAGTPIDATPLAWGMAAAIVALMLAILWLRAGRRYFLDPLA